MQKALQRRQAHIFASVELEKERLGLAVFRQHADPAPYGVRRRAQLHLLPADPDLSRGRLEHAEERQEKLALSHAVQAEEGHSTSPGRSENEISLPREVATF